MYQYTCNIFGLAQFYFLLLNKKIIYFTIYIFNKNNIEQIGVRRGNYNAETKS